MRNPADRKMVEMLNAKEPGRVVPMMTSPTEKQARKNPPKIGRNDPCPCGSGKKFKKCHLR